MPANKLNLPKATAAGHRHVAQVLWRKIPTLPKEQRARALHHAQLHAHLARALDADPDLGRAKSLSEGTTPPPII
jgi:hypothetical protein